MHGTGSACGTYSWGALGTRRRGATWPALRPAAPAPIPVPGELEVKRGRFLLFFNTTMPAFHGVANTLAFGPVPFLAPLAATLIETAPVPDPIRSASVRGPRFASAGTRAVHLFHQPVEHGVRRCPDPAMAPLSAAAGFQSATDGLSASKLRSRGPPRCPKDRSVRFVCCC